MGKPKATKRNRGHCATYMLHSTDDIDTGRQLVHPCKIPVLAKKVLLPKVGRSPDDFKGTICYDCIITAVPTFRLSTYTPKSVTNKVQDQPSVQDELDISGLNASFASSNQQIIKVNQPSSMNELDANGLNAQLTGTQNQSYQSSQACDKSELGINGLDTSLMVQQISHLTSEEEINTEPVIVISLNNIKQDLKSLDANVRALLAYELAVIERPNIKQDTLGLTKGDCRDLSTLSHVCKEDYLMSRNKVLVQFLTGLWVGDGSENIAPAPTCSGYLPFPIQKPSDIYKIAKVTEACMGLTTQIKILPFHFRELVLLYSMTRSRTALTLMSSTAPHGSYQTVRTWLDKLAQSDDSIKLPSQKGDFLTVFDNNQVLQRRWNISVDNKATSSVITMVMFIQMEAEGKLQFQEDLKPGNWMWRGLDTEKRDCLREGHRNVAYQNTKIRKHYHPWLTDIIQQVALEQTMESGQCTDDVDRNVASKKHAKKFKTCSTCGNTKVERAKRKCPSCNEWISSTKTKEAEAAAQGEEPTKKDGDGAIRMILHKRNDSTYSFKYQNSKKSRTGYEHLKQHHPEKPPQVTIGDPIFVNPCSYDAVARVFRNIGKQAGIRRYGGSREWLSIVCDGLPYVIGYQLIERTFLCWRCGSSLHGSAERDSHREIHEGDCEFSKEFDWVLLQPGPGHIEMNMLKTFVKFSWSIFWECMVEVFDFKSELAKRSAQNVNDHHKGWTLARIARDSFAKELVLPYVRGQIQHNKNDLSVAGFHKFTMHQAKSPNYALMLDLIFVMLDAIFLYRAGLRSGDTEMIDAGRAIFCCMWSARSHPLYRQLSAYDTIMSACMPKPLLQYNNTTKSINLSGAPYSGEGADFKLEEVNKNVQHWLPSAPTHKDWKNACSNHPKLAKLRQQSLKEMQLKDPKDHTTRSRSKVDEQVHAFRTAIRESEFLSDPDKFRPLTSFGKDPLDEELPNFAKKAAEKELIYLNNFFKHHDSGESLKRTSVPFSESPIFVTPQERADYDNIKNKTVSQCIQLIHVKISQIQNYNMRMNFLQAFDLEVLSKKGKKKQDYLDFYELIEEFESCGLNQDEDSDNDDEIEISQHEL